MPPLHLVLHLLDQLRQGALYRWGQRHANGEGIGQRHGFGGRRPRLGHAVGYILGTLAGARLVFS